MSLMFPRRRGTLSRSIPILGATLLCFLAGVEPVRAVSPIQWSQQGLTDFEKGKPDGVAVTARVGIVLARAVRELPVKALEESSQPFLWSEAIDSKGSLYVGSGNDGKVFKIPKSGAGNLFYSSGDLAVQAVAVDSRDYVYVGTSPEGKVYRVAPDGKGEVWFDPDERYIWALVFDRSGNLFVATGEHGIIYKVSDKGKGTPFFDSEESHIVSLAFDRQGNLLAGSSGKGLLYRVAPDGKGTVVLDTALREVNTLAVDPVGRIYASAIVAEIPPLARPAPRPRAREVSGGEEAISSLAPGGPPNPSEPERWDSEGGGDLDLLHEASASRIRSQVYRVDSDGLATQLWSSETETVFSLAIAGEKEVYLGTGGSGKIRRLDADGSASLVAKLASSQVTALLSAPDGSLYAAGSNGGKVYLLDREAADSGVYLSPARDATTLARWGRIGWTGTTPAGTRVELSTRSGNSAVPDATWSDWSPAYVAPGGSGVVSPTARFIQWKARLSRQAKGVSPILEAVSLTYLPANLPPKVEKLRLNPPGVVLQKPPFPPETIGPETAFSEPPTPPAGTEFPSPFPVFPGKKVYQRGMRSISWEGSDPNEDTLRYNLFYRGEGEEEWRPLARGVREGYFAWDSVLLPDGRYRIRIVATDAPSNPPGNEKTGEEISSPFVVDNSPPRIETTAHKDDKGAATEVRVSDITSPIRSLEYSLDAASWVLVMPQDGIADSLSEQYRLTLERLPAGEHTLLLKATDAEGNVGTAKVALTGG